jgi:membrane associated rhomboid family serine protease
MWRLRELLNARAAWVTAFALLIIYFLSEKFNAQYNVEEFYSIFGLTKRGVTSGKIWQFFSYAILHGSWSHVTINTIFIVIMGSRVEVILGSRGFFKVTTFGIILGGIFHLVLSPGNGGILVGFSAACMSLLVLVTTLSPESRMMPLPLSGKNLCRGILISSLLLSLMNPMLQLPVFSVMGKWIANVAGKDLFQIGHACHLGGGIAGYIIGKWILRERINLHSLQRKKW